MIELQVINYILQTKNMSFVIQNGITAEYFTSYRDEFEFIQKHFEQYGVVPDRATFIDKFEDFDLFDVQESEQYLVETLQEEYLYVKMVPFVRTVAEKVKTDARLAVDYIRAEIDKYANLIKYSPGYDILLNAADRKKEYEFRNENKGLLGISTGIPQLDEITHGWLPEDLVVIGGRSNEGKTWVLLYFLVQALQQEKKVLLYSGEMSRLMIGFRFDTLYKQFNNLALMRGDANLGVDKEPKTKQEYYDYLNSLPQLGQRFTVVTPADIGGRLDVNTLWRLIEQEQPDIVGIDQISLMNDIRKGQSRNERYGNIAADLYLTSEKYKIPILTPAQVNREAEKRKDKESAPKASELYGSDGILHNATRVITIKKIENAMKLLVVKNRYGLREQEIMLVWDINNGIVKPFLRVDRQQEQEVVEKLGGEELF